jgi:type IV pilus assembly protein PilP
MNKSLLKAGIFAFSLLASVSTVAWDRMYPPEPLEAFALEDLRYVGYTSTDSKVSAVITDPTGDSHRVTIGNHLGKNYGEIMVITENEILLRELIVDGEGAWVERQNCLHRSAPDT